MNLDKVGITVFILLTGSFIFSKVYKHTIGVELSLFLYIIFCLFFIYLIFFKKDKNGIK